MKQPISKRNALSMAALVAVLSTTLIAPTAMADANHEAYANVNKGWLHEYEGPTSDTTAVYTNRYRSIVGDNDTYGFIGKGWLSEYAYQPGDSMIADTGDNPLTNTGVIHRFERRLDWLGTGYWD